MPRNFDATPMPEDSASEVQKYPHNEKLSNKQFLVVDFPDRQYSIKFNRVASFSGGQASIHHGWLFPNDHKKPVQEVAVKVFQPWAVLANSDELMAVKRASHPDLIPEQILALSKLHEHDEEPLQITDFEQKDLSIIVFEWADPTQIKTLKTRILETFSVPEKVGVKRMTLPEVRSLILQLGGFISVQAEQNGIVHFDLKPANFFEDSDGQLLAGDFGMTKNIGEHTDPGMVFGTPDYLPYWRLASLSVVVNEVLELPAVALLIFQLLTGKRAYEKAQTQFDTQDEAMKIAYNGLSKEQQDFIMIALRDVWHITKGMPEAAALDFLEKKTREITRILNNALMVQPDLSKKKMIKHLGGEVELVELRSPDFTGAADFTVQLAKELVAYERPSKKGWRAQFKSFFKGTGHKRRYS